MFHADQCLAIFPALFRINYLWGPICYIFKDYSQVTHILISCCLNICSENNIDALKTNLVNSKFKMYWIKIISENI